MVIGNISLGNVDLSTLSFGDAITTLLPLLYFIIGMAIYAIFVYKFYRFVARRDIFTLNLKKKSESFEGFVEDIVRVIFYVFEYLVLFPIFTFFWVVVLAGIIALLSKTQDVSNILLVAMALVGSVRISAYYNEDLSRDLAKMLPFALLGIFLLDISMFSYRESLGMISQLPGLWKTMLYYFLFIVVLEFVLRMVFWIFRPLFKNEKT